MTYHKNIFFLLVPVMIFSSLLKADPLQIVYHGHSCFEFQFAGRRIIVDPVTPEWFKYKRPSGKFDYGFSSHNAKDHAWFDDINVKKTYHAGGKANEFYLEATKKKFSDKRKNHPELQEKYLHILDRSILS